MKYLLSHPRLTKSSKPLTQKIKEISGREIISISEPNPRTLREMANNTPIRYGNSRYADTIGNCEYNPVALIRMAGNKLSLSKFLAQKDFSHIQLVDGDFPEQEDYPICIRHELNRGGGVGIEILENPPVYAQNIDVWSTWYNFQFELGVHILGGNIVRVFKKVRGDELEEEKYPIRNTQRGYSFKLRNNWKERYTGLEKFVDELYKLIPIQFARLDIGYDKETGGYRLIEINSAPDLSQNPNTLELYARFLAERIFNG